MNCYSFCIGSQIIITVKAGLSSNSGEKGLSNIAVAQKLQCYT